jgi:cob(I)alamin adenosyltransferase
VSSCKNLPDYLDFASVYSEVYRHKHYAEKGVDLKRGVDF